MPPRLRPTARILTPAGWAGLAVLAVIAGGATFLAMALLPRV